MSVPVGVFGELLERERQAIDSRLRQAAAEAVPGPGPLPEAIGYACAGGGKRLRGVFCLLAHRAVGGVGGSGSYDVAAAVELVHTYSLVHDDLPCMDDDDLRRGRPTVHRVFGSETAALAGVALIPLGFQLLLRGAAALRLSRREAHGLALTLARGIGGGGMVGGQWQDLVAEGQAVSLPELTTIHEAKTGALFSAALALGGQAAQAPPAATAALAAYGGAVGLAFQVVDDLLDESADSAALGKTAGKDRRQAKATYPALLGIAGSRERARRAVAGGLERLRAAGIASAELEAASEWVLARDH